MYGYVYKTTNNVNGKIYVGKHKSVEFDTSYLGSGKILKTAVRKFGRDNFFCEVLEWGDSEADLIEKEKYWIKFLDAQNPTIGYNILPGGENPIYIGKEHPMYGKHHSEESKHKNSVSHKGKKQSVETIEKRIGGLRGKPLAVEHRNKISMANKGRICTKPISAETRQKLSNAHKGKPLTLAHRKALSDAHKGNAGYWKDKHRDEDTKQKISATLSNKPHMNRRIIFCIDNHVFYGLDECADYFNVTKSCVSLWLKKGVTRNGSSIRIL